MTELKPCPFCGGKIEHYSIGYTGHLATDLEIQCDQCHAEFEIHLPLFYVDNTELYFDDAIKIWNTREGKNDG